MAFMTTFDERDRNFENKFAHDEELAFKINARLNKLIGLWAAARLGKTGSEAEEYAKDIVLTEFDSTGNSDIVEKLLKDFAIANVAVTPKEIKHEMDALMPLATRHIMGE
jgi:hypothetical protein